MMIFLEDLQEKARCLYGTVTAKTVLKACCTDGTTAMLLYRLMQGSRRWKLEPLAMLFNKLNSICCQCVIGRGAEFGPGFVLLHSNGIVINGAVRGGRSVRLEHQVTIGADNKRQSPVLGNDVFVGAGAKIIGPVKIGNRSLVGANAVVVKDVPADASVGGVPAKVLRMRRPPDEREKNAEFESVRFEDETEGAGQVELTTGGEVR